MLNSEANDLGSKLLGVVIPESNLPQYVFLDTFGRYLFFDADIGSSNALISTLHEVAKVCLGLNLRVDVFASSNLKLLDHLDVDSDWVVRINEVNKTLLNTGDCNGLILVDDSRKWVVYQKRPVDVGVFAFDPVAGLSDLESTINDCFFDCNDIKSWFAGRSQRDIDLTNNFGRDYLAALMRNYCNGE